MVFLDWVAFFRPFSGGGGGELDRRVVGHVLWEPTPPRHDFPRWREWWPPVLHGYLPSLSRHCDYVPICFSRFAVDTNTIMYRCCMFKTFCCSPLHRGVAFSTTPFSDPRGARRRSVSLPASPLIIYIYIYSKNTVPI